MAKHYDTILGNRPQGFRAGGLVVRDGKILLMHQILGDEDFYTLPWEHLGERRNPGRNM